MYMRGYKKEARTIVIIPISRLRKPLSENTTMSTPLLLRALPFFGLWLWILRIRWLRPKKRYVNRTVLDSTKILIFFISMYPYLFFNNFNYSTKIWIYKAYEEYKRFLFINLGFVFITKKNFDYLWRYYIKP